MSGVSVLKHRRLASSDEDDEDEDDEDELLFKRSKKYAATHSSSSSSSSHFPSMTSLVPEGQDFRTSDFVVLKEDAERESAPIWRLDFPTFSIMFLLFSTSLLALNGFDQLLSFLCIVHTLSSALEY